MKTLRYLYLTLLFVFILGNSNGYIALWRKGEEKPLQVYPYRIEMLPAIDRQALEQGIHIANEQQLNQLLEDYLS